MMESRKWGMIGVVVLVGAFAVRLVYLLQVRDLPVYYQPILDAAFLHGWANTLRQHPWAQVGLPFREPLYAYFLASIYVGLRESLNVVRVIQCILGGLTAALVYYIGRRLYGILGGAIAGILFALSTPAVFFASELNEVTLTLLLLVASAYLLLRANDEKPYLNAGLSGLLIGAAFVGYSMAVAALPAWLAGSLASGNLRLRRATLVLIIGFLVVPVCYQFFLVQAGQRTVFPLRASWHAFLGSGATGGTASEEWYEINVVGRDGAYPAIAYPDRLEGQRDALRFAAIEDSTNTTPMDSHHHWQQRVWEDFAAIPLRSVKTYFTKLGLFWGASQPPLNLDMRFLARHSALLRTKIFSFAVIAALGLVGLVTGVRRKGLHLTVFVPLMSLVAAFLLVSDAAKVTVVPFLCVFGGYLLGEIVSRFRRHRRFDAVALAAGAAIVGVILSALPTEDVDRTANLVATGDAYGEVAVFDRAEELYAEAISEDPGRPEAYVALAKLYGNTGKPQQGIDLLNTAAGSRIDDPRIGIESASLLIMAQDYERALSVLEGVQRTHPYEARLHQLIGLAYLDTGRPETALKHLEKELEYAGGGLITYSALGRAEHELGQYEKAVEHLESALFWNPYDASVSTLLADTYSRLGQHIKACEVLGRILNVDPGNMPLRFKLANCLFRADRPEDALEHFKKLHKYDPANADILVNMGTVYAGMDSLDRAVEVWKRALVLDPDNDMAKENLNLAEEAYE
jgi:tetratricopeptide (TPR) repeat protein